MLQKTTVYLIYCSTGCTCCSNENHYYGPYLTESNATSQAEEWAAGHGNPLASQYAENGRYRVEEVTALIFTEEGTTYYLFDNGHWCSDLGRLDFDSI
jgi:hypothetical protein